MPVGHGPVDRQVLRHRPEHDAVARRDAAQRDRAKQHRPLLDRRRQPARTVGRDLDPGNLHSRFSIAYRAIIPCTHAGNGCEGSVTAAHPRCLCEGCPHRPGRASSKESESWRTLAKLCRFRYIEVAACGSDCRQRPDRRSAVSGWDREYCGGNSSGRGAAVAFNAVGCLIDESLLENTP